MGGQSIERLVIESSHELSIGRLRVRSCYLQRPTLVLPWSELIAEAGPRHIEMLVGLWTKNPGSMRIQMTMMHPSIGDGDAIAIFRLIVEGVVVERVVTLQDTTLHKLAIREHIIIYVVLVVGIANLDSGRKCG